MEQTHGFVETALGIFVNFICRGEAGILHSLIGKRLGSTETGQTGFDLLIDVACFLFCQSRCSGHILAHGHDHNQKHRNGQRHDQRQFPADGDHDDQCADDGQHGGQQIFRTVVGKFDQVKQVCSQAAHEHTGAVLVIKIKAHFLHLLEQIPPDIRFHTDAKGMAKIGNHKIQQAAQNIAHQHRNHDCKESPVHLIGQPVIQGGAGHQRKHQIDERNAHSGQNIDCE